MIIDHRMRHRPGLQTDEEAAPSKLSQDMSRMRSFSTILVFFSLTASAVASPVGEWFVQDRTARIAIQKCGPNLCGRISWSSDGGAVGRAILIDMKPTGPKWTGTVVDVRDNTKYLAHISLQSEQALKLDGCVMEGAICSGEIWTRYK